MQNQTHRTAGSAAFAVLCVWFFVWPVKKPDDILKYEAPEYADRDRNPVLLLMDGCLGTMMKAVELPPHEGAARVPLQALDRGL
jgi:hypothetical protein